MLPRALNHSLLTHAQILAQFHCTHYGFVVPEESVPLHSVHSDHSCDLRATYHTQSVLLSGYINKDITLKCSFHEPITTTA